MPAIHESIDIDATPETVFDLIHDYSRRLEWDSFLRDARLLHGASHAAVGTTALCVARRAVGGVAMESVYVSFDRPRVAAVRMTRGPFFLESFAATLRHDRIGLAKTRVTYRYSFQGRPRWLAPVMNPIIRWIFSRETRRRLLSLKHFLEDREPTCLRNNPHECVLH